MAAFRPEVLNYDVGWICAIGIEYVVACELLDEEYVRGPEVPSNDENAYTYGRIDTLNVVIACLPKGKYGTTPAASVAKDMRRTFASIRIGLMVGIGGGAPTLNRDIRLGDVVVSSPFRRTGGVIHYDHGKTIQNRKFESTGSLNKPPLVLLNALQKLEALHERKGHTIAHTINAMLSKTPRLRKNYQKPEIKSDVLYKPSFIHVDDNQLCSSVCIQSADQIVERQARDPSEDDPFIHYGLIASADKLMKDAVMRDHLAATEGVMCLETEAAGLMDNFPCVVIRGICDYSDTHKNDLWQRYAAATAAAYAKELLLLISGGAFSHNSPRVHGNAWQDGLPMNLTRLSSSPFTNTSIENSVAGGIAFPQAERHIQSPGTFSTAPKHVHLRPRHSHNSAPEPLEPLVTVDEKDVILHCKGNPVDGRDSVNPNKFEDTKTTILADTYYSGTPSDNDKLAAIDDLEDAQSSIPTLQNNGRSETTPSIPRDRSTHSPTVPKFRVLSMLQSNRKFLERHEKVLSQNFHQWHGIELAASRGYGMLLWPKTNLQAWMHSNDVQVRVLEGDQTQSGADVTNFMWHLLTKELQQPNGASSAVIQFDPSMLLDLPENERTSNTVLNSLLHQLAELSFSEMDEQLITTYLDAIDRDNFDGLMALFRRLCSLMLQSRSIYCLLNISDWSEAAYPHFHPGSIIKVLLAETSLDRDKDAGHFKLLITTFGRLEWLEEIVGHDQIVSLHDIRGMHLTSLPASGLEEAVRGFWMRTRDAVWGT